MPIYEFRCQNCGHFQEFYFATSGDSEKVEMKCGECGGTDLVRVLSRTSYTMGSEKGLKPTVTSKECGPGNTCSTIEIPGHTRD